ncbi:T-lymphocyte activation antigen CD80 isoform X2 [Denticeps clupeoides]|nr:T-lymphocyte activation antigen CD80-like isoform X2 [Denticeps clupeoides]
MALEITLLLLAIFKVTITGAFLTLKCQNIDGVYGQISEVHCHVKSEFEVDIEKIFWKKDGVEMPMSKFIKGNLSGDERFSIQIHNKDQSKTIVLTVKDTQITDQGQYQCIVVTDRGVETTAFTLRVSANYQKPNLTSKDIKRGSKVDLICRTSGGYPLGHIHWFDMHGTNWSRSAEVEVIEMPDQRFEMLSRFNADSDLGSFNCTVLNSKWEVEGRTEIHFNFSPDEQAGSLHTKTNNIAAGVVVIGSLICGLLIVLLVRRRRSQRARRPSTMPFLSAHHSQEGDAEVAEELNPPSYNEATK